MWRLITYLFTVSAFAVGSANACSCYCEYGEYVSDYVQDRKVFWGIPLESKVETRQHPRIKERRERDYLVTKIQIVEGYGRHQNGAILMSAEPYQSSCADEFDYGKPALMTAWGPYNKVGGCGCEPPYKSLFSYLKTGQNTFLPDPEQCRSDGDKHQKPAACDVWYEQWENGAADYSVLMQERERVMALRNLGKEPEADHSEITESDIQD